MPRLRRQSARVTSRPGGQEPPRLPQRWAIIAIATLAAGGVGYVVAGVIAAITVSATVMVALHKTIN